MCSAARTLLVAWAVALPGWLTIAMAGTGPGTDAAAGGPILSQKPVGADELGFDEIVFVKRKPYSSDHYYTDINNGTSGDRFVPENGIYVYNLRTRAERPVVTAANMPGGKGFIGKISLSFDAKKVLFDFRENPGAGFRIWEVGTDGTGLRQVSFPPKDEAEKVERWRRGWHTDDIHPCYLPDGGICFTSSRCRHGVLCDQGDTLSVNTLYRMNADGSGQGKFGLFADVDGSQPDWSRATNKIVFVRGNSAKGDIWVMDGGSPFPLLTAKKLTENIDNNGNPAWSPDGRQIAYVCDAHSNLDIYIMNADGSNTRRLTYDKSAEGYPAWRP